MSDPVTWAAVAAFVAVYLLAKIFDRLTEIAKLLERSNEMALRRQRPDLFDD